MPELRFLALVLQHVSVDACIKLTTSFLSAVPALVYSLYALPRLLYILPRKHRRLLPLSELPATGIVLLASRLALATCLLGASISLGVRWEQSPGLGDNYTGQMAWALEIIAAVSTMTSMIADTIGDDSRSGHI